MKTEYWGMVPYREAWDRQTELFNELVRARACGDSYENRLIFCEHPHVYTLGRHGKETNMLLREEQLKQIGAELYHIDRGGDITYHGPGQLVCYPILNLEDFHLGLKDYIHALEEAVIRVCASYGHRGGEGSRSYRRVACRRNKRRTQDLCDRRAEQSFRDDARTCPECEYRFALFRLHPSLRVYR